MVHVIPLLVETGQAESFDIVVVVDVEPAVQRARLAQRDGLSESQIAARIAAQSDRQGRLQVADDVIGNSGDRESLASAVAALWERLVSRRGDLAVGAR